MANPENPTGLVAPNFALDAFTGAALTIAQVFQLTRVDGVIEGYSTHDRGFTINSVDYKPCGAFTPLSASDSSDLAVDRAQLGSYLDIDAIRDDRLAGGLYSGITIETAFVDYQNLPATIQEGIQYEIYKNATIRVTDSSFTFEILGTIEQKLRKVASKLIQPSCPHDFGDENCGFDISTVTQNTTLDEVTSNRVMSVAFGGYVDDAIAHGTITFTSGLNTGVKRDIASASSSDLELVQGLAGVPKVGDACTVVEGCPKTWDACGDRWNNRDNFGGVPNHGNYMPGNRKLIQADIDG